MPKSDVFGKNLSYGQLPKPAGFKAFYGGEGGIRTLDTLLGYTRFPIVRARPDYATSPRLIVL